MATLFNRNHSIGLLLIDLRGFVCGFSHAPTGIKRIGSILRSKNWTATVIDDFLFAHSKNSLHSVPSVC